MTKSRMQAKHVPTSLILQTIILVSQTKAKARGSEDHAYTPWVLNHELSLMLPEIPFKVLLAKLRNLYRKKLIEGCPCGCRGDWYLLEDGYKVLLEPLRVIIAEQKKLHISI